MKLETKQLKLLNETINHFNSKNRSINSGNKCVYYPNNNKTEGCAIGRLISKKLAKDLDTHLFTSVDKIFNELPIKIQNYGKWFLRDLQRLHDNRNNWNERGLSKIGKNEVKEIKKEFNLN